jgi:hypothetical protein
VANAKRKLATNSAVRNATVMSCAAILGHPHADAHHAHSQFNQN